MNSFRYFFILLFLIFPLGQITRFSLSPSIHLYAHDVVVSLLLISWVVYLFIRQTTYTRPPLTIPMVCFAAWGFISLVLNTMVFAPSEIATAGLYLIRWIVYASLYVVTYDLVNTNVLSSRFVVNGLLFSGTLTAVFGLIQYLLYPRLRNLMYLGWDPHEYRVFGTFFDSAFIGIILVVTILLIVERLKKQQVTILFLVSIVMLTYSRSSYIGLLVGLWTQSLINKSYTASIFITIFVICFIPFLPKPSVTSEAVKLDRMSTIEARVTNYEQTQEIIAKNWLWGTGFNTLRYVHRDRGFVPESEWATSHAAAGADNSLLFVWATTGIIGLVLYTYLLFRAVRETKEQWRTIVFSTLTALGIHSLFNNTLFYPWVMIWIWLLLGIAHGTGNTGLVPRLVTGDYFKRIISFFQLHHLSKRTI